MLTFIRCPSSAEEGSERVAAKSILEDIKKELESHVGEKIRLKANKGRKKVDEKEGILEKRIPIFLSSKLKKNTFPRKANGASRILIPTC